MDRFHLAAFDPAQSLDELMAVWRTAFTQEASRIGVAAERHAPLLVAPRDLALGGNTWLACRADGELVGLLAWGPDTDDPTLEALHALAVLPAWQREGVGTRLLHALEALCDGQPLVANVPAANEPMRELLQARGWRAVHKGLNAAGVRVERWLRR